MTLVAVVLVLCGAWWRWFDGTDKIVDGYKMGFSNGIAIFLVYLAAYISLGSWLFAIPIAGVAAWSLLAGFKTPFCLGWHDTKGMFFRFGIPAIVIVVIMAGYSHFGLAEPKLTWVTYLGLHITIPYAYKFMIEEAARLNLGAVIVGSLLLL